MENIEERKRIMENETLNCVERKKLVSIPIICKHCGKPFFAFEGLDIPVEQQPCTYCNKTNEQNIENRL
jgi:hypothetical protein